MSRKQKITKVVALAATKGGVGKTTLSCALAVRAVADGDTVALIDADPTASLEAWWKLRGKPENPQILGLPCSAEGLELVRSQGWDWLFIDTPPAIMDEIEQAVFVADFVLIPTRASSVDLLALDQIEEVVKSLERPFAYVLNAVDPPPARLTSWATLQLRKMGDLIEPPISNRKAYASAMASGRTGPEIERGGGCASEIDALWASVKQRVAQAARAK